MEEEKAHHLYLQLQSTHHAAKQKRGLGFGSAPTFGGASLEQNFVPARPIERVTNRRTSPSISPSSHRTRKRSRSPSRQRSGSRPRQPRGSPSIRPPKRTYRSRSASRERKKDKRHKKRRSKSRSRSRNRNRKKERKHRSRSRSSSADSRRYRGDERSRKRSHRSRSRSADDRHRRKHSRRGRSCSKSRDRRTDRRTVRSSSRDRQTDRWQAGHNGAHAKAAKPVVVNYADVIPGYSSMTAAEQLKARMKHQMQHNLHKADKAYQSVDDPGHARGPGGPGAPGDRPWTRFVFNKDAYLDEEGGKVDLDFAKEAEGAPRRTDRRNDTSHEAAIFGTDPTARQQSRDPLSKRTALKRPDKRMKTHASVHHTGAPLEGDEDGPVMVVEGALEGAVEGFEGDEDAPVLVDATELANTALTGNGGHSTQEGDAEGAKAGAGSWRERAAALRRARQARDGT